MTAPRSSESRVGCAPGAGLPAVLVALVVLLPGAARAAVELPVYQATVPVPEGAAGEQRAVAYAEALRRVVVRASGRRSAADAPAVVAAAARAGEFVQQYSSQPGRLLRVGFDGRAVEQLLGQAGLPVWPAERPVTLVVLALPGAGGTARAVLASERPPGRLELESAAQLRGVPIAWPSAGVDVAAARAMVEAGDAAAVSALAQANGAETLLVGVAGAAGVDWRFAFDGKVTAASGTLADGAHVAADQLAAAYAPAATRSVNDVLLTVAGIDGLENYAGLLAYLAALSPVRSVAVEGLTADRLSLRVAMRGNLELLRRLAALGTRLEPGVATTAGAPTADFNYLP